MIFKAMVNFVEPKIRLETRRLETLISQKTVAGDSCKEAKRLAKDKTKTGYDANHAWDRELATFFSQFYGIDVDHGDLDKILFPTFEEILGILELAESQEESFRDWPGPHLIKDGTSRIRHVHDLLVFLIGEILDHALTNQPNVHRRLLVSLDSMGQLEKTAIFSFNYDILADNAMLDHLGDLKTDYGIDFVNQERPSKTDPRRMLLLKLHGSLNWLYCPTCRDMEITPHEKGAMKIKWEPHKMVCISVQHREVLS